MIRSTLESRNEAHRLKYIRTPGRWLPRREMGVFICVSTAWRQLCMSLGISMTHEQSLQQVTTALNLIESTRHQQKGHHSTRDSHFPERRQTQTKRNHHPLLGCNRRSFHAPSTGHRIVRIVLIGWCSGSDISLTFLIG